MENKITHIPVKKFNIAVCRTHNFIGDTYTGISHQFFLEKEEDNILDFYAFCLDITRGLINKSLSLHNLPEIHKSIEDQSIDHDYLMHEIDKKLLQMYDLIYEKKKLFNES
jgi:hypothetical protein